MNDLIDVRTPLAVSDNVRVELGRAVGNGLIDARTPRAVSEDVRVELGGLS